MSETAPIASLIALCDDAAAEATSPPSPPSTGGEVSSLESARRLRDALTQGLRGLPTSYKLAVGLHFCWGMEIEEISALLGTTTEALEDVFGALSPADRSCAEEARHG